MEKKSSKRKSVATEIIEEMERYLERIDNGEDKHFNPGVLKGNRSAARYAISNAIGYAKAIKESRKYK